MNQRVIVRFQGCCYQDQSCRRFPDCSTVRFTVSSDDGDPSAEAEFTACVVPPSEGETCPSVQIFPEVPDGFDVQAIHLVVTEYFSSRVLQRIHALPPLQHTNATIDLPWMVYFAVGDDGTHRWHPFAYRAGV
jgi:hypothetical protein